jgi:hypothetical protein
MDPRLYPKEKPPAERPAEDDGPLFAVEFVKKDGERHGFPYAMLSMASYSPEDGMTAVFGGARVTVTGSGIDRLYRRLLRRELIDVTEAAGSTAAGPAEIGVERIAVETDD